MHLMERAPLCISVDMVVVPFPSRQVLQNGAMWSPYLAYANILRARSNWRYVVQIFAVDHEVQKLSYLPSADSFSYPQGPLTMQTVKCGEACTVANAPLGAT
jgi:hypothetical protein